MEHDENFPRVAKGAYSSGKDEDQQSKAQDFLKAIKVRPVDEVVEIEAILKPTIHERIQIDYDTV